MSDDPSGAEPAGTPPPPPPRVEKPPATEMKGFSERSDGALTGSGGIVRNEPKVEPPPPPPPPKVDKPPATEERGV